MKAVFMIIAAAATMTLVSCKSSIDYIGEANSPTSRVDYFFSKDDIKKPYKTMGKAIVSPGLFESSEDMQNDLMEAARQKGADAVFVESFQRVKTGENTTWSGYGFGKLKKADDSWWSESGAAHTQDQTDLLITVFFLKYHAPDKK